MATDSYTLYIHDNEMVRDIDDDLYEPAAFQIPFHMLWKDLQDLIYSEVGHGHEICFTYLDDENDKVKLGSQDEYEVALNLAIKSKRDLHIYAEKKRRRGHRRRESHEERRERKRQEDVQAVNPYQTRDEEEVDILRPPVDNEDDRDARTPSPQPEPQEAPSLSDQGAAAPKQQEQEDVVTSTSRDEEETLPMPVVNPILTMIKKEVQEVVNRELEELWECVNEFKRDVNEKLDAIGEHSVSEVQIRETEPNAREETEESSATDQNDDLDGSEDNFAASFVCENLLDGSFVHTGASFEKYWVFKNEGSAKWNDNTKLHLLEENCNPAAFSGDSLSEWGAKKKSVGVPHLKQGESGVVCVEHLAPRHRCDYNSSWRLSHDTNAFGPRVWCNVRVVDDAGTPSRSYDSLKAHESFEVVSEKERERAEEELKTEEPMEKTAEEQTLVPPQKINIGDTSPSPTKDAPEHCDNSILSFNMDDISDGAKYLPTSSHVTVPYNPAVTTVVQQKEESSQSIVKKSEMKAEDSVDALDLSQGSQGSGSPVMVEPLEVMQEVEVKQETTEEPKTLEAEEPIQDAVENPADVAQSVEEVENFTEPVLRTPDHYSEGEVSEEEEEIEEEAPAHEEERSRHESGSSDLHSVDYNLDDNASMTSYDVSDFVVVPLPECFDVNRPLNVMDKEEMEEKKPSVDASTSTNDHPSPPHTQDPIEGPQPNEESSDEEIDSQPNSTTLAKEYRSEDSLSTAPKTPTSTQNSNPTSPTTSLTPRVNLAPNFVLPNSTQPPNTEQLDDNSPTPHSPLNAAISQNFEAFTIHPENPPPPATKPKIPMNQLPSSNPKTPVYNPNPIPVPQSVLNIDDPYDFKNPDTQPYFPPFDQGWRRNPLPVPPTVTDDSPWVRPKYTPNLPESEITLNRNSNGIESTLPSHPFAAPESISSNHDERGSIARDRNPSPTIELPDDFFPPPTYPGVSAVPDHDDEFRTPPPSPTPAPQMEPTLEPSDLDQLYEMGFHDMDLNREIYERCGHDINRTVQAIVLRMQADDMMP